MLLASDCNGPNDGLILHTVLPNISMKCHSLKINKSRCFNGRLCGLVARVPGC
jgi:hypothetical protein